MHRVIIIGCVMMQFGHENIVDGEANRFKRYLQIEKSVFVNLKA